MANWRRKQKTGLHRVRIPGIGWLTVFPGRPITDQNGALVDCRLEAFGSQADNYEQIGVVGRSRSHAQSPPVEPEEEITAAEKVAPPQARYIMAARGDNGLWWDVINPANPEKPVNPRGLKKADAEELLASLLHNGTSDVALECPYEDEGFGKSFDLYEECGQCNIKAECEAALEGK